jgi:hypothetical protein
MAFARARQIFATVQNISIRSLAAGALCGSIICDLLNLTGEQNEESLILALVAATFTTTEATSQVVPTEPFTSQMYLAVLAPTGSICGQPNVCLNLNLGVPLTSFVTTAGLDSQTASINARLAGLDSQVANINARLAALDSQVANINAQLATINHQVSRSFELIAAAAALKDAIPNHGDRFAVRLNAAAFNGEAAGALGIGLNVSDNARLNLNYGQGRSQSIVSGGLNLSFR